MGIMTINWNILYARYMGWTAKALSVLSSGNNRRYSMISPAVSTCILVTNPVVSSKAYDGIYRNGERANLNRTIMYCCIAATKPPIIGIDLSNSILNTPCDLIPYPRNYVKRKTR